MMTPKPRKPRRPRRLKSQQPEPIGKALAAELFRLRGDRTQTDVSQMTGIPQGTISNWEKRKTRPSIDEADRLLRALGGDLATLLKPAELSEEEMEAVRLLRAADPPSREYLLKMLKQQIDFMRQSAAYAGRGGVE